MASSGQLASVGTVSHYCIVCCYAGVNGVSLYICTGITFPCYTVYGAKNKCSFKGKVSV